MPTWLPPLVAAGAIAATYFLCIRPHLRGRGCGMASGSAVDTELDRQLAELREEVRVLHAQDLLDTRQTPRPPGPPQES